jgi:hypothetical protein
MFFVMIARVACSAYSHDAARVLPSKKRMRGAKARRIATDT